MKYWLRLVSTLVLAGAFLGSAPMAPAQAAQCGGTWVYRNNFRDIDGNLVAQVNFFKSTNGAECFRMESIGPWEGITKYMSLTVCGSTCISDSGNFANYAGPVTKNEANRSCYQLYLIVHEPNGRNIFQQNTFGGSCN